MENISHRFAIISVFCFVLIKGSVKKGVAVAPRNFLCDDFEALNNIAWWHDWGDNLDFIRNRSGCTNLDDYISSHVPMTWGYGTYFSKYYLNKEAEVLMGFNEPNHKTQANIDPIKAAKHWKEVEKLANGRPIVSPSPARCDGRNCICSTEQWFDKFFENCVDCRIDYLATHVYNCDPDETMEFLEKLYHKYGRKIWLTEFACPYSWNEWRQLLYMDAILPMLEKAEYIYRYSWFVSRLTYEQSNDFITMAVNLLDPYTSKLTFLGEYYNSFVWND